ncbi:MAG TPA: TIGR03118 family protein [Terriglobales bacterium]|nr:TIGR03118 family protein [Terriglobales bacterium]
MKSKIAILFASFCLTIVTIGCGGYGSSQRSTSASGFRQTNLVSDTAGNAAHTDSTLINPWGIAFSPNEPFWIAANNSGRAKVYDPAGTPTIPLGVAIPTPSAGNEPSTPTGIVFNPVPEDFKVSDTPAEFVFATEDGTVSTWAEINGNRPTVATMAIDNSATNAVYKGIAILTPDCCREFLALADFHNGSIATYDISFDLLATAGTFTDPNLPDGYAPFNIQQIGNQVFVTYALQNAGKHDPVIGAGNGIVNVFDQEGNFVRRFTSNGALNAPWGIAKASANFGPFSNAILIGNFGDGIINAFDSTTGTFLGSLKDQTGNVMSNPGLWALTFRLDGLGDRNILYITAGATNEDHGLFAAISFHN